MMTKISSNRVSMLFNSPIKLADVRVTSTDVLLLDVREALAVVVSIGRHGKKL